MDDDGNTKVDPLTHTLAISGSIDREREREKPYSERA